MFWSFGNLFVVANFSIPEDIVIENLYGSDFRPEILSELFYPNFM
jgi:hypothetical protein